MSQDTVSREVFRSSTEGRPGRCWDSNPSLTTDVFHILCSSLFTDIQFSGSVYPEHGLLRRYNWVALLGSSRELTRRIEKFKNLHTKYHRTGCLLRILLTLNDPSLNFWQHRQMNYRHVNEHSVGYNSMGVTFLATIFLVKQQSYSKKGSSAHLLTVKISSMDACFQQLCRFLVWISCLGVLLSVWLLVSKTVTTWWRVRSLCCLLASWPRALWQIFK
jgi:hypothetical protein